MTKKILPLYVLMVHMHIGKFRGLYNAPATFQRCMMAIFSNFIEDIMEVFMNDFSVCGTTYDHCLKNLSNVLQRFEDMNLVLH